MVKRPFISWVSLLAWSLSGLPEGCMRVRQRPSFYGTLAAAACSPPPKVLATSLRCGISLSSTSAPLLPGACQPVQVSQRMFNFENQSTNYVQGFPSLAGCRCVFGRAACPPRSQRLGAQQLLRVCMIADCWQHNA